MKPSANPGSKRAMAAHWSRVHKGRGRNVAPMSREAELEAMARFEAERGVTACERADQATSAASAGTSGLRNPMPGWR